MNTSHLVGQAVEIRVAGVSSPVSAVVLGAEAAGLWIHKGNVVETIMSTQKDVFTGSSKDLAVFVPFVTISWLMTAMKEALYQKAR
jgi:hypothetical protein